MRDSRHAVTIKWVSKFFANSLTRTKKISFPLDSGRKIFSGKSTSLENSFAEYSGRSVTQLLIQDYDGKGSPYPFDSHPLTHFMSDRTSLLRARQLDFRPTGFPKSASIVCSHSCINLVKRIAFAGAMACKIFSMRISFPG